MVEEGETELRPPSTALDLENLVSDPPRPLLSWMALVNMVGKWERACSDPCSAIFYSLCAFSVAPICTSVSPSVKWVT